MKAKINHIHSLKTSSLNETLPNLIISKHNDLLRVANTELIILFWQIGTELNRHFENKNFTQSVSSDISKYYGTYFSEGSLKKMRLIARQLPRIESISAVAPFITWQHLLMVSKFESFEAKVFYLKQAIEKGLNARSLGRLIKANESDCLIEYRQKKGFSINANASLFQEVYITGLMNLSNQRYVISNLFDQPQIQSFREVFTSSKNYHLSNTIILNLPVEDKLQKTLFELIKKYTQQQQQWFNGFLNICFWEIGNHINQGVILKSMNSVESVVNNVALQLKKRGYAGFSKKRLKEMAAFADQFDNLSAVKVANLLSWQHIILLLSFKTMEAKLFYVKLAVINNLSPEALGKVIAKDSHEEKRIRKGADILDELIGSKKEINRKKKNGKETIFETLYLDFKHHHNSKINFLKNPYFRLLTSIPEY